MKKEKNGRIGFIIFLLVIFTLIIGGQYLYSKVLNKDVIIDKNNEKTKDYRIDKDKDYFYFINDEVISEHAEIFYKDVVINIKGQEHLSESLNEENEIYQLNDCYNEIETKRNNKHDEIKNDYAQST